MKSKTKPELGQPKEQRLSTELAARPLPAGCDGFVGVFAQGPGCTWRAVSSDVTLTGYFE